MKKRSIKGYTLIELLTVMAITAILMTLIVLPVFQSFSLVRTAQAFADAQDRGRVLTERISRDISNAVGVRDTDNSVTYTRDSDNQTVTVIANACAIPLPAGTVTLPYTKLDLWMPAQGNPGDTMNGAYLDPITGKGDPTLKSPKGQVVVPVGAGTVLKRYFLCLRDPLSTYNNPYDGLLMSVGGGRDNLVTLYSAEVAVYLPGGGVNTAFFDTSNGQPILDDPSFMIPNRDSSGAVINDAKLQRIKNWLSKARNQLELFRYDMIMPQYDKRSRVVATSGGLPVVTPLIQFRPSLVSNDPAKGQLAVRSGEESANATLIGSDVYQTQFGGWSHAIIRNYPPDYAGADNFQIGFGSGNNFAIYQASIDPSTGNDSPGKLQLFDLSMYNLTPGPYRFSAAAHHADFIDKGSAGGSWIDNSAAQLVFSPYNVLGRQGKVLASFGIDEVGIVNEATGASTLLPATPEDPQSTRPNLPTVPAGPEQSFSQDNGSGVPYSPLTIGGSMDTAYSVNRSFNRVWNEHTDLQPRIDRFLDLRVLANEDGTLSPLCPTHFTQTVTGMAQCNITPGSDIVYAPDQNPGPHYGKTVRYVRVTGTPGPNQYRINYVDQPEPNYSVAFPGYTTPPTNYDPTDFMSAVIQPRFKRGYIQFNSDPNVPIPSGPIKVFYRFQFTRSQRNTSTGNVASSTFTVDYDTRQLISILLTMRNFPQANVPNPQTVTLRATANVRNAIR